MPYKDPEKQRAYQRRYKDDRRKEWLRENGPCRECGSWDRLEVDHVDPSTKLSHRIWTWAKARREAELEKCQVLCFKCHREKTRLQSASSRPRPLHGTANRYKSLGCRCYDCTRAHKEAMRAWRAEKRRMRGEESNLPTERSLTTGV